VTTPPAPGPGGPGGPDDIPEPVFGTVEDWVDGYFRPMFRRPLGGEYRWCRRWWAHPEAVSRLTALWRSWEVFRLEPASGISDWYRDHLDHHLPILAGPRGPFFQCSPEGGHLDHPQFPVDEVDYAVLEADPGEAG
jgi:hypothetical protein